ncbi:MAG: hypothetical protein LAP85_09765 [Acidobacteriia bacterium]|nr:hypothetical protein [Terriglobia bacterium]
MKPGFWDHVRAAFNARPIGMFVPPNWVGVAAFGFLGLLNPGFWIMGFGIELAYLGLLATNERFQRTVVASRQWEARRQWQTRVNDLVQQLSAENQRRYRNLETRCGSILDQQQRAAVVPSGLEAQGEGLSRLLWLYLRLLLTRQAIDRIVRESAGSIEEGTQLEERIRKLEAQLAQGPVGEELRRSLTGQIEILKQRLQKRSEARDKLVFLDAELTRLQEQVELIREQAILSTDPQVLSARIDQVTATLDGTNHWIQEQQKIYGATEDLLSEPPPISASQAVRQ